MQTILADKYRLVRKLGEGGMGAVHEAVHLGTGRRVAVKTLRGGALFDDAALARFQREARAVGAIDTRHIVQVFDSGFDGASGQHYMAMELLAGEDLQQLVTRVGALAPDVALRIAAQACAGLAKAHAAGVVHRDVKPANIFLAREEGGRLVVKLLDFGIAKTTDALADAESAALTRTGSMIGTPLYMSPEQAKGLRTIDHRTDLWSLGAVLFQMLTGRTPHHTVEHTMGQLIVAIVTATPPSPRTIAPWLDARTAAIVERALRIDPDERFPTAEAMLEALRACVADVDVVPEAIVPPSPDQRATAPRTVVVTSDPPSARSIEEAGVASTTWRGATSLATGDAPPRPARRGPGPAVAVVAAVAIAGSLAAVALSRRAAPVASAMPPPPAPSAAAPTRRVAVAVPDGATVEIDGAPATVTGGAVWLEGDPGSTHEIVVRVGDRRAAQAVVIAQGGAFPPRVDLPAPAPSTSATAAPATPSAAARARASDPPVASARPAAPRPAATGAVPAHATTFE